MTPKQTAMVRVAALVGTALLVGFLVNAAFTYFTVAEIGIGFTAGLLVYMIKIVYEIELDRAERLEKLNNPKG